MESVIVVALVAHHTPDTNFNILNWHTWGFLLVSECVSTEMN